MKFSAFVGSKDEVELIGPAIAQLRAIGVDHIIACDFGSTDGTLDLLDEMRREGDLEIVHVDDTRAGMVRRAGKITFERARAAGSDWLIVLDADEFLLPATGSLKDCAALTGADVVNVPRFNVALLPGGPAMPMPPSPARYGEIDLYAPTCNHEAARQKVRADADLPWIELAQATKVMVRFEAVAEISAGGHRVVPVEGVAPREVQARDLVIAHLPFSTEARFARKLRNIAAMYAAVGDVGGPNTAWHWRRWLDHVESRGGAAAEIARNTVDADRLEGLRAEGTIKSVARFFADRQAGRGDATALRPVTTEK